MNLSNQAWVDEYNREELSMGRYAKDTGGGDFQQAPVGTHVSRCIRLIDLGTQQGEYQGKTTLRNQVLIMWELCHEMMEGEEQKPFIVSKFYTNSLSEKANLYHDLVQWRGKEFTQEELSKFDLQAVLGAPCMVSVVAKENSDKVKVGGVMKMPKGQQAPEPVNKLFVFWLDEWDPDRFESLSDGIKKIIMKSPEYIEATQGKRARSQPKTGGAFDDLDDDIPF